MAVITSFVRLVSFAAAMSLALSVADAGEKPAVPPGEPTTGPAVVLMTTGIDYTRPSVARRLARDGEGDLIGWDALDNDRRPYGTDPLQSRLVELAPVRVVPVRVDPARPETFAAGLTFVQQTPARVVVIPWQVIDMPTAEKMAALMTAATGLLFVIAAGDEGRDLTASDLPPDLREVVIVVSALAPIGAVTTPNRGAAVDVVLVPPAAAREAPGEPSRAPRTSAEAAVLLVAQMACRAAELSVAKTAADAKRLLLAAARRDTQYPSPLLEDCSRTAAGR